MGSGIPRQPPPDAPRLDKYQQRIVESLIDRGMGELAQVYLGALRILSQQGFQGAAYFVGHACREIWRGLPRWLDVPIPERVEYAEELDGILPLWDEAATGGVAEGEPVEISSRLFLTLNDLLKRHRHSRLVKRRQRAAAMFRALGGEDAMTDGDAPDALVREWIALSDQTEALAHLRRKGKAPPLREQAQRALGSLERLLWRSLVRPPFYVGVEALDDILREANK